MGKYIPFNPKNLEAIANDVRKRGKSLVLTGGCFDLPHPGHLYLFKNAKKYGDILIINILNDTRARKKRDPKRPINTEKDRALMISAYQLVDYVTIDPSIRISPTEHLARIIKPDVFVQKYDKLEGNITRLKRTLGSRTEIEGIDPKKRYGSSTKTIEKIIRLYA